eukprot:4648467-Amphidinium_carterae.1
MSAEWPPIPRRLVGSELSRGGSTAGSAGVEDLETSSYGQQQNSGGFRAWDSPPPWDVTRPETQLEAWTRGVKAWQLVTRIPARQQG